MDRIDLKKCSERTGKSESEIAIAICKVLIFKADYYQQDQTVMFWLKPQRKVKD